MSRNAQLPTHRTRPRPLEGGPRSPSTRRASVTSLVGPKTQRTSKTSQKLVVLPSAPQTKPLREDAAAEDLDTHEYHGYETDGGVREHKSAGERMSREERKQAGFKRITAYCIAEGFKMKLLASFLHREHNVVPRVFDEALYAMYHLPLLPGYGPHSNIRSSALPHVPGRKSLLSRLSEAEENGYQDTYFAAPAPRSPTSVRDGYMSSGSPVDRRSWPAPTPESEAEGDGTANTYDLAKRREQEPAGRPPPKRKDDDVAEVVFFEYGVVVFFGLLEEQERGVLEDLEKAGIVQRGIKEDDWEVEECHFAHDPDIAYPRIFNDFFTFKSPSHLLKLSVAHALAQSTLLAHYESSASRVLSSPLTLSIPQQLATSGALTLARRDALRLTGRLFKLRRDVNLVSNVLDTPELFWSEASLGELYAAVREYMEIEGRVGVLDEKLVVASGFLDAIHDHLNNSAMERITWIIIWLIVVAVLVEIGEVIARLIVHAATAETLQLARLAAAPISREDALRTLERMMAS